MNAFSKIIDDALKPLIGSKCVLLDLPYYSNVGDVLIWEGMERFISTNSIKCLSRCSCQTFEYRELDDDVCILLVGGGNFGDLWRGLQEFRNKIISLYPSNRIIVFPQSVHYTSNDNLSIDITISSKHPDLYICARDENSYHILKHNFTQNNIVLLPDMALYIDYHKEVTSTGKTLFLKREDQESVNANYVDTTGMIVTDWPMHTISEEERFAFICRNKWHHRLLRHIIVPIHSEMVAFYLYKSFSVFFRLKLDDEKHSDRARWMECYMEYEYLTYISEKYKVQLNRIIDYLMDKYHRRLIVHYGKSFISSFDIVYSTRLHAAIVSVAMGNETYCIDNTYGKISGVINCWMKDFKNIRMIDLCSKK